MMKLHTPDARVGRFLLLATPNSAKSFEYLGTPLGFETYEDADTYRRKTSFGAGCETVIAQVFGEWHYRSVAHEVHPKD
jgi:hypothetical protein